MCTGRVSTLDTSNYVGPEDRVTKDKMRVRAAASRFHSAGADGVYTFNWHANRDSRRDLLTQVGSSDTLRRKDKIYAATHRNLRDEGPWRGALRNDRILGDVPVALKRTVSGDGPTITLDVADNLTTDVPEYVELRVRLDEWVKGDVVRVFWDGAERENIDTQYHIENGSAADAYADYVSDVSSAVWLRSEFNPSEISKGPHQVQVMLQERNPKLACDIVLTNVELVIAYGKGQPLAAGADVAT